MNVMFWQKNQDVSLEEAMELFKDSHKKIMAEIEKMTNDELFQKNVYDWAVAGDIGGRALSSTVVGVLDWAVYIGAAVQAVAFGFVKDNFGWDAIFITIGCLYILMLGLTLKARSMKMKNL